MGWRRGELSGEVAWASLLSAKAVSGGGVPVRGKGGILCQVGQGLLLEIPALPGTVKQLKPVLYSGNGENGGLQRGHAGYAPATHSSGTEAGERARQEEAQMVLMKGSRGKAMIKGKQHLDRDRRGVF